MIIQDLMQSEMFQYLIKSKLFKYLKRILPTILLLLSSGIIFSGIGNAFYGGWEAFGMLCIIIGVISIILISKYTMIFKDESTK